MTTAEQAANRIAHEFWEYCRTIRPEDQDWYFDGREADMWVKGFCEWLAAKQLKSSRIRASND